MGFGRAAAMGLVGSLLASGGAAWAYVDITSPNLGTFCPHATRGTNLVAALALAFVGGVVVALSIVLARRRLRPLLATLLFGASVVSVALILVASDSATYVGICPDSFVLRAHVGYLYVLWGAALIIFLLGAGRVVRASAIPPSP
jgi:hypothetical protein